MTEELSHYGVPGMKWGVRKDRAAKKDAKEFTAAKMYYGEGAGTRRKLIKAKVEARSKRDPAYKAAFEKHVANTDMGKRARQAQGKRKRTDITKGSLKTAKGIGHILNGNRQYASLAAAGLFTAAVAAHKTGVDRMLFEKGKTGVNQLLNSDLVRKGKSLFNR